MKKKPLEQSITKFMLAILVGISYIVTIVDLGTLWL